MEIKWETHERKYNVQAWDFVIAQKVFRGKQTIEGIIGGIRKVKWIIEESKRQNQRRKGYSWIAD